MDKIKKSSMYGIINSEIRTMLSVNDVLNYASLYASQSVTIFINNNVYTYREKINIETDIPTWIRFTLIENFSCGDSGLFIWCE